MYGNNPCLFWAQKTEKYTRKAECSNFYGTCGGTEVTTEGLKGLKTLNINA